MNSNDDLILFLDDTAEEEYVKKYGKKVPPKTKEDEKILSELKRRLENGHYDLK